jgi:SPX domain protein involved in polyphosphate accumulation
MMIWAARLMKGRARTHAGFVDCSSLNIVAFAKILKKYDKVVKWNLAPMYIKEVERSYFASSDKVGMQCACTREYVDIVRESVLER